MCLGVCNSKFLLDIHPWKPCHRKKQSKNREEEEEEEIKNE